jgi:hypothetical protein
MEHIMPGGVVRASIDGAAQAGPGLVSAKAEPMSLSGYTTNMTFGLVAGEDAGGRTALQALGVAGGSIELVLTPITRTALQVHLAGSGCKATSGTIKLRTDESKKIVSGEFEAQGTRTGTMASCIISGSLESIPVER